MNLKNARVIGLVFAATAGIGMLPWASPVEARGVSWPAVPRRLFSTLAVPESSEGILQQAPADDKKAPAQASALPEGKGKALTQKDCVMCHAISVVTKQHHTREQWRSVLDSMIDKGLDAPDSDLDIIADYLAVNFGPAKGGTPSASPDAAPAPAPQ